MRSLPTFQFEYLAGYLLAVIHKPENTRERTRTLGEIISTVFNLLNLSHLYDLFSLRWYR